MNVPLFPVVRVEFSFLPIVGNISCAHNGLGACSRAPTQKTPQNFIKNLRAKSSLLPLSLNEVQITP
jgi:hypothetical protein